MSEVLFVDTETISLARDYRHLWEIALLVPGEDGKETEFVCYPTVPLDEADPMALKIGRFHERHPSQGAHVKPSSPPSKAKLAAWAKEIVRLTDGKHLVGAVPSFDEERLWGFCKAHGQTPTWHYHLVDVEALAIGYACAEGKSFGLPWDSERLSAYLGVDPGQFDRHTALGDCRWAQAIYEKVMGR